VTISISSTESQSQAKIFKLPKLSKTILDIMVKNQYKQEVKINQKILAGENVSSLIDLLPTT